MNNEKEITVVVIPIEKRIIDEAMYYVKNNSTLRKTAKQFNVSKSTIHVDMSKKLKKLDKDLYKKYLKVANKNFSERYIRGGNATKLKYKELSNVKS